VKLLQGLHKTKAGAGELAELMIKLSAMSQLPWRDDHSITKKLRPENNQGLTLPRLISRQKKTAAEFAAAKDSLFLNRDAVKAGFEIPLAAQTDDLVSHLAFIKQEQRRYGANAVFGGDPLLFIDVNLDDFDPALVFISQLIQNRRDHFAGPAPLRPEINKHGRRRLNHFLGEGFLSQSENTGRAHNERLVTLVIDLVICGCRITA